MSAWLNIVTQLGATPRNEFSVDATQTRTCSACKQELSVTEFYPRSGRAPGSYLSLCKACLMASNRARAAKRKELGFA